MGLTRHPCRGIEEGVLTLTVKLVQVALKDTLSPLLMLVALRTFTPVSSTLIGLPLLSLRASNIFRESVRCDSKYDKAAVKAMSFASLPLNGDHQCNFLRMQLRLMDPPASIQPSVPPLSNYKAFSASELGAGF